MNKFVMVMLSVSMIGVVGCSDSGSTAAKPATTDAKPKTEAVDPASIYDFDAWSAETVNAINSANVSDVFTVLEMQPKSQTSFPDYDGLSGTKYLLRDAAHVEFINVVNSQNYLELHWVKPSQGDDGTSKATSLENTRKAYQFARAALGEQGGELVKNMVTNEDYAAPATVSGKTIKTATCEHFMCTIVIKK